MGLFRMKPLNTLFILSDEHRRDASGCYGHPLVKTPNIDKLASEGTLFESALYECPDLHSRSGGSANRKVRIKQEIGAMGIPIAVKSKAGGII